MTIPRLAVLPDFPEEGWPSMDLCAEMLLRELPRFSHKLKAERICARYRRHFRYLPGAAKSGTLRNTDRLLNRMSRYPRFARTQALNFDWFHVCDHSYSQVIHALPAKRAGVFCHDLDTFRCLLSPETEPRPAWFRKMMRTILAGFQKAAVVFYATAAVREQIERHLLIDPAKLVHAPLGVGDEFTPVGPVAPTSVPYVLHVGSGIPRKRVDVLLDVFASLRRSRPGLRLEQVGGEWTAEQRQQIERLGIGDSLTQRRGLARAEVAALYRGAAAVLMTSEAEGFGLPVVESLACGATLVASDLPVLREVGGDAATYCRVADVPMWVEAVSTLLDHPAAAPAPAIRAAQAAKYSWRRHAEVIAGAYASLASGATGFSSSPRIPARARGEGSERSCPVSP